MHAPKRPGEKAAAFTPHVLAQQFDAYAQCADVERAPLLADCRRSGLKRAQMHQPSTTHCSLYSLQGLAFGFVLLRVESLAEEGKVRWAPRWGSGGGRTVPAGLPCVEWLAEEAATCGSWMHMLGGAVCVWLLLLLERPVLFCLLAMLLLACARDACRPATIACMCWWVLAASRELNRLKPWLREVQ